MTGEQARKIIRSKLKRDCFYYSSEGHHISCCVVSGNPKCFTKRDQCVGCKTYYKREDI